MKLQIKVAWIVVSTDSGYDPCKGQALIRRLRITQWATERDNLVVSQRAQITNEKIRNRTRVTDIAQRSGSGNRRTDGRWGPKVL
ncbi:jg10117 [Pararge aegeria aegeria]|uniref:Jg10117 protein n=1 Tax=Pararge aegeria aegeria TaxID=348720 RepID=A0A8S4RT36_9NEOP|nr:jg10117 [Pararge aegeria aegeria]